MKRDTKNQRADIVNSTLYHIYTNIDSALSANELAHLNSVSTHHFHRIFKEETGKNIYETIKSIRLQKAAGLLLTNKYATIGEIAATCGYGSHTSFIKAFKARFGVTPKEWKNGGNLEFADKVLSKSQKASESIADFEGLEPKIVKTKPIHAAYIRHKGYDKSIKTAWNRLKAWSIEYGVAEDAKQIGLHHDNPSITPLADCDYVAAVEIDANLKPSGSIGSFNIPSSLCAVFEARGRYGDVLRLIRYVYHIWLPNSGFETLTLPSYAIYKKNHFLEDDGEFWLEFYLPIRAI